MSMLQNAMQDGLQHHRLSKLHQKTEINSDRQMQEKDQAEMFTML